jgi:hypothetical protein
MPILINIQKHIFEKNNWNTSILMNIKQKYLYNITNP